MPAPTYSLPTIGSDTSVSDPLIRTALADLKTLLTDGLDEDNIDSLPGSVLDAASVADSKLASPNNSVYRTLLTGVVPIGVIASGTTFQFHSRLSTAIGIPNPVPSGQALSYASTSVESVDFAPYIYLDDADFTVGGLSPKLRIRAQIACNATAPATTFTVGLYPLSVAGGTDAITFTLGTVVSGSTVAFVSPSASTVSQGNSGDFAFPTDGAYALGVAVNGTLATNSATLLSAHLQVRST